MRWFRKQWLRFRNWRTPPFHALAVDDLPEDLEPCTVYLIGEDEPWQAAMLCPCGCRSAIQLSLVPNDRPRWRAIVQDGRVSLHPSVDRIKGCRSHFVLAKGRIHWC